MRGSHCVSGAAAAIFFVFLATCTRPSRPEATSPPAAKAGTLQVTPSLTGGVGKHSLLPETAIDAAVADAIANGNVPGAVVVVGTHEGVLFRRAYGFREVEPERAPMTVDTVFDLASLTKPIATATSIMALVERGLVHVDDPLVKTMPECGGQGKQAITLRQLLLHVSGLPADIPKEAFDQGRAAALRRICELKLRGAPGATSIYSDLGFLLLEEVIRRVTSQELPTFAQEAIFGPLGLHDTLFQPPDALQHRAAWTEFVDGAWRVGVVHDPRAYRLGGVAGHAGLFSTGDDVATYARAILGGGEVNGTRILSRATVASMIAPHDVPGSIRALGWAIQSTWRGEGLSPRAIGHFGFTGTALWIDPDKDFFTVILTNRVHPAGKGDSKPLVSRINTLVAAAVGPAVAQAVGPAEACADAGTDLGASALRPAAGRAPSEGERGRAPSEEERGRAHDMHDVWTGIDVLRDEGFARLRGLRVGLITNATGRARDGTSTIDLLAAAPQVRLVALFSPEHGLDGTGNGPIADGQDLRTGLPVYSLYGDTLAPTVDSLSGVDALLFDIQDAGTRFFTYGSTLKRAMAVASAHDVRFFVLDRPNPIDGTDVGGPVLVPPSASFVNYHPLAIRHGMTFGELATLFNADDHIGVALSIVPLRNWHRANYGDANGLSWVNPSPNIRNVDEALLYPAIGLLEATNLSVGRGTATPFEHLGAPWIDDRALANGLAAETLAGVVIEPHKFTPNADRYAGVECRGVTLRVVDRSLFDPIRTGLAIARALRLAYPHTWEFQKLNRLLEQPETMRALDQGLPLDAVVASYQTELAAFVAKREKYLLYPPEDCGAKSAAGLGPRPEAGVR